MIKVNFYDIYTGLTGVATVTREEASKIKEAGIVSSQGVYWVVHESDSDNFITLQAVGKSVYEFDNPNQRFI